MPLRRIGRAIGKVGRAVGRIIKPVAPTLPIIGGLFGGGLGGLAGAVAGAIAGGRRKESQAQPVVNPYAGEVWSYFKDTYLPEVHNRFGEVQSIFQNQMSKATELQNQALRDIPSLFSQAQEKIQALSGMDTQLQHIHDKAIDVYNKAQQLGDTYAQQVDIALGEVKQRLDNIGSFFDEAIQNAKSIFENEATRGRGVMALAGFTNTPLLQRTLQEEFSRIVSPFLREKAQTQAQAQQLLSDYVFKAPQVKTDIQKGFQATSLFALDRGIDAMRQRGAIQTAQVEALQRLAQTMPHVYQSIFEIGYQPARDYATMLRNFLDLQAINPTGAMNFAITHRERSVFDPLGALIGGLLGWYGSRRA